MVESDDDANWQARPPPLPQKKIITCTSSDCVGGFHSFRTNMRKKTTRLAGKTYRNGVCEKCGISLIDWERIDKRNLKDAKYTFDSLKKELIRHMFWHEPIDDKARIKAMENGLSALQEEAEKIIKRAIGRPSKEIFRDGTQTPKSGNVIFYAQHFIAACCRKCAEEWHGIDRNRPLTDDEIRYLAKLALLYVKERLPEVTREGSQTEAKDTRKKVR